MVRALRIRCKNKKKLHKITIYMKVCKYFFYSQIFFYDITLYDIEFNKAQTKHNMFKLYNFHNKISLNTFFITVKYIYQRYCKRDFTIEKPSFNNDFTIAWNPSTLSWLAEIPELRKGVISWVEGKGVREIFSDT